MIDSAYSAFGSTDPVHDPVGERVRWFCPWVIDGREVLEQALNRVEEVQQNARVSRITFRVVSQGELGPECVGVLAGRGFGVEARLPVNGSNDLVMSYIGWCDAGRQSVPSDIQSEQEMLKCIMAQPRKGPSEVRGEFRKLDEFRLERVESGDISPADINRLVWMHREAFPTFPYAFESKLELMLSKPDTYLMVQVRSKRNQQIYSFSNLELNDIVLSNGSHLRLGEYDNTMRIANCPEHGAVKGLGAILRLELALQAARHGVDLCHAESRAGLVAINAISYHTGMVYGGTLDKHLFISGESDIEYDAPLPCQSMNVWYFNRFSLAQLAVATNQGTRFQ